MKVKGLNGRDYKIKITDYIVKPDDKSKKSQYHLKARELIKERYNGYTILEEVKLPGIKEPGMKSSLFIDFLIPSIMVGIEVHGQQHYEFSPFFHKNKAGFYASKKRDRFKRQWCDLNNIELIELKYSETILWAEQLE